MSQKYVSSGNYQSKELEPIRYKQLIADDVSVIEPDKSIEIDGDEIEQDHINRRRDFIMTIPVSHEQHVEKFRRGFKKIRGYLLWKSVLDDVKLYGTKTNLKETKRQMQFIHQRIMKQRSASNLIEVKEPSGRFLLNPNSKFLQIWSLIVLLLLLYTFTFMPWVMAFETVTESSPLFIMDQLVDILFFIDIIIIFNTKLIGPGEKLVSDRYLIIKSYAKGMFIIDFMSVFPFYFFTESSQARSNSYIRFLRLTKLAKIFRASKIAKIIKSLTASDALENFLKTNQGITRLIGGFYIVVLLCHFTACMWYYTARLDEFSPDTWVVRHELQDKGKLYLYFTGLYWALTILTTVGFGDIHAQTEAEMSLCIIWMIFGVGFYSFIVGTITSVLTSIDAKGEIISQKIQQIELYAKDTRLPPKITKRIIFEIKNSAQNVTLDDNQRSQLLMHLSSGLRYKIAVSMYNNAAQKIQFLSETDPQLVATIVPKMKYQLYKRGERIYSRNDFADEVYFIINGRVDYLCGTKDYPFKSMISGSFFGEIEIIERKAREFSVVASGTSDILTLHKYVFEEMMFEFPRVAEQIKELATERKNRNIAAKTDVLQWVEENEKRQLENQHLYKRAESYGSPKDVMKSPATSGRRKLKRSTLANPNLRISIQSSRSVEFGVNDFKQELLVISNQGMQKFVLDIDKKVELIKVSREMGK